MNSETGTSLKIRVLNASKRDLARDLQRAVEFDQSQLFKKIYENEFGTPGGEPYGALIGDYEWTQHPDDVETLRLISNVAAGAFAPFISAAGPGMFGFDSYTELAKPRDLAKIFETTDYTKWRSFRDSEDARFVTLVMPRTLARLPYGAATKAIDEFNYEEAPYDASGAAKSMEHNEYCWMNAAYAMGTKLTDAFAKYGFCTAIRGAEGGGKVENLPTHVFTSDDGDMDAKCPTEIGDHRPPRVRVVQPRLPAAVPLQEYRLFGVLRRPDGAEAEEVRPSRGDRQCGDLRPAAVHHGLQPLRALPEGDGPRQDRQLHGSWRRRALAEPLDLELRERQRERRPGDEGPLSAARGEGRGSRNPRQAGLLQRRRLSAAVAANGRTHHQPAHGGAHSGCGRLTCQGQPDAGSVMNDTGLLQSASATVVADAAASAPLAPALPPVRHTMLTGRFIGKRDFVLEDTVSDFLLSDGGDAVRRWFGAETAQRLLADPDYPSALRGALDRDIAEIDTLLSEQVDAILHEARLRRLEGTWRGIAWLVDGTDQSNRLKIKLLNAGWAEIAVTWNAPSSSTRATCSARSMRMNSARPAASRTA